MVMPLHRHSAFRRMTEEEIVRHVGDILSLIAARFTRPHRRWQPNQTEFHRCIAKQPRFPAITAIIPDPWKF
ncbi:hypothetical protein RX327_03280 [Bradyrhizobium sp. BEA-2-5]|uniref:hypothetical protein n=1 Tax=Bradyrhizobium TaxID=374 RepID=UPI00128F92EC|nr:MULTISPECIES: hypothetical protein [Bradyrhizobium]WOH82231.1 hypothetical protein RX327_03280 [Bradyrhizobium sp. BEA-2-5]